MRVSDAIAISHSGVSADGRVICAAAQRLAVEHAFTFEEDMPIEAFLEELSLLFQRYTMKPGSRPFGCSLLVTHMAPIDEDSADCCTEGVDLPASAAVYLIDPSGAVELMGDVGCIGTAGGNDVRRRISDALIKRRAADSESADEAQRIIVDVLREELEMPSPMKYETEPRKSFLTASFMRNGGLVVRKIS